MLYFGRVGSLWGLCAKVDSSWGENVITPKKAMIAKSKCIYQVQL